MIDESAVGEVEVSTCCGNCHDPVFSKISGPKFSADVGLLQTFFDSWDGDSEAVLGPTEKSLG